VRDNAYGLTLQSLLFAVLLAALDPVPGRATDHSDGTPRRDAYVLARGGRWSSTNGSLEELRGLRLKLAGDFLWFRRGGTAYVVRDAAVLHEAFSLFAGFEELEPEQSELQRSQRRLDAEERALDREQEDLERLTDRRSDAGEGEAGGLARRQRELEARQRAFEAEERRLSEIERSLDERQDAIERRAEAGLWRLIDRAVGEGLAQPAPHR
jgi:hypothetical protein